MTEATVVGKPDKTTVECIFFLFLLKRIRPENGEAEQITKEIGPIAKLQEICFGDNLSKSHSCKIIHSSLDVLIIAKDEKIIRITSLCWKTSYLQAAKA